MILGFKQTFPWGEPTNFREKILAGAGIVTPIDVVKSNLLDKNNIHGFSPKLHTMRIDPHDRWKPGMKIDMVYRGAEYKILDRFNENIPELQKCVSVQKIRIIPHKDIVPEICVDGKWLDLFEALKLIHNDGFYNVDQFNRWFKKEFTGKIIHWTDLRY